MKFRLKTIMSAIVMIAAVMAMRPASFSVGLLIVFFVFAVIVGVVSVRVNLLSRRRRVARLVSSRADPNQ